MPSESFPILQFSMQLDSLLGSELLLLQFELRRQIEQAKFLFLLGNHFVEKRQMVAKENNARSVVYLRILTDVALEKNSRHRRHILVAKSQVGLRESGVPGLYCSHTDFSPFINHMSREYLLRQGHGASASLDRRQEYLLLHPRHIEWKQSAVFNHLPRDFIFTGGELRKCNFLPAANPVD